MQLRNLPSESSSSLSEETLLASPMDLFSTPVCEAISSHKKSAVPTDPLLSSTGETSGNERVGGSKKRSSHVIDSELSAENKTLIAKVQDFQQEVKTNMKQNHSQNHNVITFEPDDIVTFCIPKKDRAATDDQRVVVMIKSIPYEGRHKIRARFCMLDQVYPTSEPNIIPSVDQDGYRKDFLEAPTKLVTLHAFAAKFGTSNKVAVSGNCKKFCTPQSKRKCRKNKVECSQYYHNPRHDYENTGSLKTGTDVTNVRRREERTEDESKSDGESSKSRSQRLIKRACTSTNSNCNQKKSKILPEKLTHQNAESETKMQRITLSQYENIASVVNCLQGLRNRVIKRKKRE